MTKIALIDGCVKTKVYPLGLLKIGAWQQDIGNQVKLFDFKNPPRQGFDEYWISTTFTYDIPKVLKMLDQIRFFNPNARILIGGISATLMPDEFEKYGYEVHKGLLPEAEKYAPDYSLLNHKPEYSISHTTRGCIRKCGFCMVKNVEPDFIVRKNWTKDLHPNTTKIVFYDNNWLAKPYDDLENDVTILYDLIEQGKVTQIDFNQALDCRLVDDKIANLIAGLPMRPWRFSFDGMHENGYIQNAINKIIEYGYKKDAGYQNFVINVLFNFKDTPQNFYFRLKELARLTDRNYPKKSCGFPMKYQPIMQMNSKKYVGKHWTSKYLKNYMYLRRYSFNVGIVSSVPQNIDDGGYTAVELFEFYYGRDDNEFLNHLNMDLSQLKIFMQAKRDYQKENKYQHNFMRTWYENEYPKYVQG